jgi:hypothetical protein
LAAGFLRRLPLIFLIFFIFFIFFIGFMGIPGIPPPDPAANSSGKVSITLLIRSSAEAKLAVGIPW